MGANGTDSLKLADNASVAIIGGGPAGSLFGYFLLDMAQRANLSLAVDLYEPRRFSERGPAGCNMCGGIISESLVQLLATEGINLPETVVQRGIDSYVLHTDLGRTRIDPPGLERRIAAVHRGAGPRGSTSIKWGSFDAFLLDLTAAKGARVIQQRVDTVNRERGKPILAVSGLPTPAYDLVAVATGINSPLVKTLTQSLPDFVPPQATKTFITDCHLGQETVDLHLGSSMHVFLLDLPRLEFAAIIPKGEYATICLLGTAIDKALIDAFFATPEVINLFPAGWKLPATACRCSPAINVRGAPFPFADRLLFLGDAGVNRLYKDGIGGAYRAAKSAARAAVFSGVSMADLAGAYGKTCRAMTLDNNLGRIIFTVTKIIQKVRFARRAVVNMTAREQVDSSRPPRMSSVLWDTFTGSASYVDVFKRTLHPAFLTSLALEAISPAPAAQQSSSANNRRPLMNSGELGKTHQPGEIIFREGEQGTCMYVVQSGKVEVLRAAENSEIQLAAFGPGEIFGEMVMFGNPVRSATVRVLEEARILTIDRKIFMQKIHQDPSLAFRVMEKMSQRIRTLNDEVARLSDCQTSK